MTFSLENRDVELRSGSGDRDGWQAYVPKLGVSGALALSGKHPGSIEIQPTRASGRVGSLELRTLLGARLRIAEFDPERKHTRFSGDVSVGPAELEAGSERVEGWWAHIALGSGLVTASNNLDLSALFQADLRDATPGLAVLESRGSLPALLADNIPREKIAVTGIVQRRCRLTDFVITRASSGPLNVRGRLHSTTDSTRAALLLRVNGLEAISAGLTLAPSGTGVSALAGDDWLNEHKAALDEAARKVLDSPCPEPPGVCSEGS
ncbi:MAG: hypothetical protein QM756_12140 [Polyangiaceae bacterium]